MARPAWIQVTMGGHDDERFRLRPGAPRRRGDAFVSRLLRQVNRAGGRVGKTLAKAGNRPAARLGRGHVAARFAGLELARGARRVTVKTRVVNLKQAGARSTLTHLRYIEREGVDRDGGQGHAYDATKDELDTGAVQALGKDDRHQFRLIVSAEDAVELGDLRAYTRQLMSRMEADLGTRLEWVAVDHWNTDNPHTHVVLRGKDQHGGDLIIAGDYIADGMRVRARELATQWLGPRTELEMQRSALREVGQERWTGLDRMLQLESDDGVVGPQVLDAQRLQRHRQAMVGRLQHLQRMGLAGEVAPGTWQIGPDAERTLRAMGERGDIVRTMQRSMAGRKRELSIFDPVQVTGELVGRVIGKGLADELYEKGYLIVDGIDGRAHYVPLSAGARLDQFPIGSIVQAQGQRSVRASDRAIVAHAEEGVYQGSRHLTALQSRGVRDPEGLVAAHTRRLEALRRAGVVERIADGIWRVPKDLPEQGRRYDRQRNAGAPVVELKSHLTIDKQVQATGATWLDEQLIGQGLGLGHIGFGAEARQAVQQRAAHLTEQGLATPKGAGYLLSRNLLHVLRCREMDKVGAEMAAGSGLAYRSAADGKRFTGVYRRDVLLTSGRYAMLETGRDFCLVPWRPVIERRLGQTLAATLRGAGVNWEFGRQRGPSV